MSSNEVIVKYELDVQKMLVMAARGVRSAQFVLKGKMGKKEVLIETLATAVEELSTKFNGTICVELIDADGEKVKFYAAAGALIGTVIGGVFFGPAGALAGAVVGAAIGAVCARVRIRWVAGESGAPVLAVA